MARLIVMRHGEAEDKSASGRDKDRALTLNGQREVASVATALRTYIQPPELVLVSGATRTQQTADIVFEQILQQPVRIDNDQIYNADGDALLEILRTKTKDANQVMIIGHNPGLIILLYWLLAVDDNVNPAFIGDFPPATLAELVFEDKDLNNLDYNSGRLLSFLRVRDLHKSL